MHRVFVIGSPGAGKSLFSQRLANLTQIPLVHLDELYWLPHWERRYTGENWIACLEELVARDRWIIDGNYSNSLELRARRADQVVALQYRRSICLYRAVTRAWFNRRPDRTVLNRERLDWSFVKLIWRFPEVGRQQHERLDQLPNLQVTVLRNDREANDFRAGIRANSHPNH